MITWGILVAVIAVLAIAGLVAAVMSARRHPDPLHSTPDPVTGISEEEWMRGIR